MLSGKSTNRPLKPKLAQNYGYTFLHIFLDITEAMRGYWPYCDLLGAFSQSYGIDRLMPPEIVLAVCQRSKWHCWDDADRA